jgi:LuxR family maltose regulon positive regulatory protein
MVELRTRAPQGQEGFDPDIWEFDLEPPPSKTGHVFRSAVVGRISDSDADVITVVAPAGYGKTTTLAQWARTSERTVAWLTLRAGDNHPQNLLLRLASSVSRQRTDHLPDTPPFFADPVSDLAAVDSGLLMREITRIRGPFSLVLDNVHLLRTREVTLALETLVEQLEGRAQLVLLSRSEPDLPLAAMRATRGLLELSEIDLAMNVDEVSEILEAEGGSGRFAEQLALTTGGWPAAISLVLASKSASKVTEPWAPENVDHHYLAEYVTSEILPSMSRSHRDLLSQLAPMERINPSLAEAVSANTKASATLRRVAASSHLIRQVGDGSWYEMHQIVRRVLRADLELRDPLAVTEIHARAASWYQAHDMALEAIGHAQKAGDTKTFASLMEHLIKRWYVTGHVADVLLWMTWLERNADLDEYPNLAAIGALVHMQEGNILDTEKWLEAASRGPADSDTDAVIGLVRASATRSGVQQMLQDAEAAQDAAGPSSRWLPAILVTKGIAHLMDDDLETAEACFVEAATTGMENQSLGSVVLALGQRALLSIERKDWDLASKLVGECLEIIDEHKLDGYQVSGLGLVAAARCARRDNEIATARSLLTRASLLRPRFSAATPGESLQTLIEMAKTYIELSDVVGARALVREADDIVIQRPNLGVLPARLNDLRAGLAGIGPGTIGLSALTKAELRLLPFLATNLSFPEIGERLYISRHTVKTQAMSIYRKLGTSSRSDAVAKAYEAGLLHK